MAEAVVEYDYEAEQKDELTLKVGDVIKNVVTAEGGWWEGELNGKKGMFPENFVKLRPKDSGVKKEEKREATQRKSVRELANKFKDGVPMGSAVVPKKKEAKGAKRCKVLFEYKPENEDELELLLGAVIDFNKEVEDGWWEGSVNGKTGVFPSNFVEMLEDSAVAETQSDGDKVAATPAATVDAAPGDKENFKEIKGKKIMGIGLGNIFEGGPIKLRNTSKKGDTHRPKQEDAGKPKLPDSKPPDASAPEVSKRDKQYIERAVVRFSYAADQPDELSLKEGEIIRILDKNLEDEGWWRGEINGKSGVFPDNFVELLPVEEEPVKAPKKPPPPSLPSGKSLYPKLPDKAPVAEDKSSLTKKDQSEPVSEKPTSTVGLKKPLAPPPVGRKPGPPQKPAEVPSKPDPSKVVEPPRQELRSSSLGKESSGSTGSLENNHIHSNDKKDDGDDTSFDVMETSGHKLVHLTASRAKGPKKRPPSTVLVLGVCMASMAHIGWPAFNTNFFHSCLGVGEVVL